MSRKEKYINLHDNPGDLFKDCLTVLFPFDLDEIWIGDGDRSGFRIRAEKTKNGLCLHITHFEGSPPITVINPSGSQVTLCQINNGVQAVWSKTRITQIRKAMEN